MAPNDAVLTSRLDLRRPVPCDVAGLFAICSDSRVWSHYPSGRHRSAEQTRTMVQRWQNGWDAVGLGAWSVRLRGDMRVIGYGGCWVVGGAYWNLGYRLAADAHGHGHATELACEAVARTRDVNAALPVVAYLVEGNFASERVARKAGLTLVYRAPDAGNPDASAIRLVYADRRLTPDALAAALR